MTTPSPDANARINLIWERVAIGLLTILLSILFMTYQSQKADIKELQGQVTALQMTKVSKEDLREVEQRINVKMDAMATNLISMGATNKADILSRLDFLFGAAKGK